MPAAGGATPPQTPPVNPTPDLATPPPATGASDADPALGDAGKRAIQAERERAKALERERDTIRQQFEELQRSSLSDHEKAIADAVKAAKAETAATYEAERTRDKVRLALMGAGIQASVIELAVRAPDFDGVKPDEIEDKVKAFVKTQPALFAKPSLPGADLGAGAGSPTGLTLDAVKAMKPAEYAKRRDEVMDFLNQRR